VLEARDRAGGRIRRALTRTGESLEAGGELLGIHMRSLIGVADECGLEVVPVEAQGAMVRFSGGQRYVETSPYEAEPHIGEAEAALAATLDELAREVPVADPWNAPRASDWDSQTLSSWVRENIEDPSVRGTPTSEFDFTGATAGEISLLFALWLVHSMGGWESWRLATTHRLLGGTSALVDALVGGLRGRIFDRAAVRRVDTGDEAVTVGSDRGSVECRAVVAALSPILCGRIEWEPALPLARERLQTRFLQGHGIKFVATYAEPWWRAQGLAGLATGLTPIAVVADVTGPEHRGGHLAGFVPVTGQIARDFSSELADRERGCRLFLEQASRYLGPGAADVEEVHMFDWSRDPWTIGAAVGLPPGVLSTVGSTLREPIGRIVWAGAETGLPQCDWLEGAVSAAERAVNEVEALLRERA